MSKSGAQRRAIAKISIMAQYLDIRELPGQGFSNLKAAVRGAVVNNDQFQGQSIMGNGLNTINVAFQGLLFVVAGDHQGEGDWLVQWGGHGIEIEMG